MFVFLHIFLCFFQQICIWRILFSKSGFFSNFFFFAGIEAPRNDSQSRRPSKSNSLAEDILAIRSALDGASASARERTLKILERLTARLAVAESERDVALGKRLRFRSVISHKSGIFLKSR